MVPVSHLCLEIGYYCLGYGLAGPLHADGVLRSGPCSQPLLLVLDLGLRDILEVPHEVNVVGCTVHAVANIRHVVVRRAEGLLYVKLGEVLLEAVDAKLLHVSLCCYVDCRVQ